MRGTLRSLSIAAADGAIVIGTLFGAATWARAANTALSPDRAVALLLQSSLITLICLLCLMFRDVYDVHVARDARALLVRLWQALGAAVLLIAVLHVLFPAIAPGRRALALAAPLVASLLSVWRLFVLWLMQRGRGRERLLLIGTTPATVALARELHERKDLRVEIVGFIDADPAMVGTSILNPGVIGVIADVPAVVRSRAVDRVVVSLADAHGKLPMGALLEMKLSGVSFAHLASVYEDYTGKISLENLRPSWLIFSSGFRKSRGLLAAKRAFDLLMAITGLVLGLPVMLLIALVIKLTAPGPALYRQHRVGLAGRLFVIHKFRSMREDAEAESGAVWAQKNDDRVTPIGRFLRRYRLDELPQLWNVLCGDMSFVGPRPERPEFVRSLTDQIPFYGQRHVIKPGLTGWAQVCYTYGASIEDAMEKLQYDLYYIKHLSIAFDFFILLKTVKTLATSSGG